MASVLAASKRGRLAALRATREKLAQAIDEAPPTMLPNLTAQFRSTLAEIDELSPSKAKPEKNGLSELEEKMRERDARAKVALRASAQ